MRPNLPEQNSTRTEAIDQFAAERDGRTPEELQFLNLVEEARHLEFGAGGDDLDIGTEPDKFSVDDTVYMGVPGLGWGNVAASYASKFGDKIRLNSRVTEIDSQADETGEHAVVTYEDGDGRSVVVKAKTVLVTVSVGVLKAGSISFVPEMPSYKKDSIDAMGFGLINKVSGISRTVPIESAEVQS